MSNQTSAFSPKSVHYKDLLAIEVDFALDARGLSCPMPLLKAKQALHRLSVGDKLRVIASDRGSVRDIHSFAELSGQRIFSFSEHDSEYYYIILKTR